MNPEQDPMDSALERAIAEIREETVAQDVIDAAAARVWERISAPTAASAAGFIRGCEDFRALMPDYRAGLLNAARTLLLKDHLNECVECRKEYGGKIVEFPARPHHPMRRYYAWAAAAAGIAAAGLSGWLAVRYFGPGADRVYAQALSGSVMVVSANGVQPLAAGREILAGVEIRTAKGSSATLTLGNGSTLEIRERSALSTSRTANDLTVHLNRGAVLVQAAKRRSGHLYVTTADCRAAVTGTVFSVNAGVKGSRVSVMQGEVRVSEANREEVLKAGQQTVIGPSLESAPLTEDVAWSPNRARFAAGSTAQGKGVAGDLLSRVPESTVLFAMLPAPAAAADTQATWRQVADQQPEFRLALGERAAGVEGVLNKLQSAGYADRIAVVMLRGTGKHSEGPVYLASVKKPGIGDFIQRAGGSLSVAERPGLAVIGSRKDLVQTVAAALDGPKGAFAGSPCYARLAAGERAGTAAVCADLARMTGHTQGAGYLAAESRSVNGQPETRVTLGFDGPRTGMAAWLAPPAPMGALDFVSPNATFLAAFVVTQPSAILDEMVGFRKLFGGDSSSEFKQAVEAAHAELSAGLGGEFALAMDGPMFPTPSWKVIVEAYDPTRFQAAMAKLIETYNAAAGKPGSTSNPVRTSQEVVDGRTYYKIGGADQNPLTEAVYVFSDGYLIAGPSRAVVGDALQTRTARTSITRSNAFVALMPHDRDANFSAVVYQNLGTTLAPLAGLIGGLIPGGRGSEAVNKLANLPPQFIAAYAEPDAITLSTRGAAGPKVGDFSNSSLFQIAGGALPLGQLMGTRGPAASYR